MAEKTIRQQPVALDHVTQVTYLRNAQTGSIDVSALYRPVDETGAPIGEPRVYNTTKVGPAAEEIATWIETKVLPEINEHEGT
jgi:hypothetical protein